MHKRLDVGVSPTSKISRKNLFAEITFAKTWVYVFSALTTVSFLSLFAPVVAAPAATTNSLAVNALPTGGQVVAGQATISQTSTATAATMNINQTSQRAVVNWDSFNVGKNAQVNFNQPNQNAVILNRVTGANASVIEGAVKANGQVILVNPNGVTFGRGSQVDAAGVVASTLNIANKEFMDGKSTFKGNGQGAIINEGKITTNVEGGYIALLAPEVRNQGYLLAIKGGGTVAVAAGEKITLNFQSNSLISVKVDVATYKGLIENKHVVEAHGGLVVMAAGAANQLMASVIKNTGRISAGSAINNGGTIELVANTVTQAGIVSADSKIAKGGQVNIVGSDITMAANSVTIATGALGGGQVNIGLASTQISGGTQVNAPIPSEQTNDQAQATVKGNAHIASNAKQMARTVTVEQGAIVDTSATQSGNGGSIAIWSELKTTIAGVLKSMGGVLSGNGGFIETSSKITVALAPTAQINTSASNGKSGTWLLDPIDLIIDTAAANIISAALSFNNVIVEVNANTTACPSLGGCTQNGSGSLTIASGADILKSGTNLTTLTLSASGIFNLNANISGQNLAVVIRSSIAYLNVGTSITANTVTVQAQTIYAYGIIQASNFLSNTNSTPLGNTIHFLAQAIYVSGRLSLSAGTPNRQLTIGLVDGNAKRPEDLPSYLIGLNASASNLDQVYSSSAANDASDAHKSHARQGQSNVIQLVAADLIDLYATALVQANGTFGGSIDFNAPYINIKAGSVVQANGNNGPGGLVAFLGNQITVAGNIAANGSDGGIVSLIANNGDLDVRSGLIQTNGGTGRGGSINLSATNHLTIQDSSIEATGLNRGGKILIGNDARDGTLPFALLTRLDQYTSLNATQLDQGAHNHNGGLIETSGQTLQMLSSINAGRGGMWLIDPTNVTISTTSGTSTGTDPLLFTNQTNISAAQIQTAINAGISVQIIADGTITQTASLSFAPASGITVSLTYDNRTGTAQAITLTGTTTNTGAGDLTLNYLASGQIKINNAINSTSTGKINVVAQTSYATNALTGCSAGGCANIVSGASGSITTKGGYVVLDGTGGTITGTAITIGSILNGSIYLNAAINTTTDGTSLNGPGGNLSVAGSANLASGIGSFEPHNIALNIGGNVNIDLKNYSNANYGFVFAGYGTSSPITTYGDLNITSYGVSTQGNGLIYLTSALTSTTGNINLTATSSNTTVTNNPGVSSTSTGVLTAMRGSININSTSNASTAVALAGAITAHTGITINANGTTASTIASVGAMTLGYGYYSGDSTSSAMISSATGTSGSLMGAFSGSTLPVITAASLSGTSVPGTIATTAAILQSTTATTATYLVAFSDGTYTKMVQVVLTASNGMLYATETLAKYKSTQLASGSDVNLYGGTTNLSSIWTGSTAMTLATSSGVAGYGAANIVLSGSGFTPNTPTGNITITANNTAGGGNTGITQSGEIINRASGSNITFTSNNLINQTGAITLVANTSSSSSTLTYDTTRGTNASTITSANVSIASGSTSAINYLQKSAGAKLDPGVINVPGSVTLDNTYGCTGTNCIAVSDYIVASNISLAPNGLAGVVINNAITATGNIVIKGASNGNYSIYGIAAITSTGGDIVWTGIATNYGIYTNSAGTITTSNGSITITGNSTTGAPVDLNALLSATTGITITGNGTTASTIVVLNAMTLGPGYFPGSRTVPNFISTSSGSSGSLIGDLSGSTLPILSGGDVGGAAISGTEAFTATAISLQSSTATTATYIIGFNDTVYTKMVQVVLTSSNGLIYATQTAAKYSNASLNSGTASNTLGGTTNILSLWSGSIGTVTNNTLATSMTSGAYGAANLVLSGSGYSAKTASGNISVTANNTAAGGNTGISQSGAITMNSSGGSISFISNNKINQTGAISMLGNTSGTASSILYDTATGNKNSSITSGNLTFTSSSSSDINYIIKSSGSAIDPAAIGTSSVRLPGTITLDNTYGGSTPVSSFITTSNNTTLATGSIGVTINNALYSTKLISIKGTSYTSQGVNYSAVINASAGGVDITGTTYNNYGVYTSNASLITGDFITVTGRSSVTVAGWLAQIGALTINSGSTGGDILVTATGSAAGSDNGIYQSGAISAANGSDVSFISNNYISQNGAITMAANTNAISTITYDATSGNRLSTIGAGVVSTTSGSTFAINYLVKSAGSAITVAGAAVPGYINIDNTYGSASGAKSSGYLTGTNVTTSNTTGSAGVLVNGTLTAGGAFTIKGISASSWGIQNSSAYTLTAGSGDLTLLGVGIHGIYQMGSLIASAGNIYVSAYATSNTWSYYAESSTQKNYIASGNIDLISYSTTYSSALNIHNILMRTTSGDITLSARGGIHSNGAVSQPLYMVGVVIASGGDFTIQGATVTNGVAVANLGTAAGSATAFWGVDLRTSASLAYGGITYTGYKAVGDISIAGTSNGGIGVYSNSVIQSTAGSVSITGTSTSDRATYLNTSGTVTGVTGVAIYGRGASGSVTTIGLIRNSGATGGVIINAATDANIGAVTNSGADGIRITGGNGIAAGTTTGGTITALGTVTNTGGVVALSMASPRSANSYDIEGKLGITTLNASDANIRYSVQGGNFTIPSAYTSGNYIDYRAGPTTYTITVSLGANYSADYGTAYTDSTALSWLRTNATVTLSATPFGVSATSIKSGLVWNSTIGSAGVNANSVQAGTTIVSANILAGTGQCVTLSGTSRTYTITAKALTITNLASTSNYDSIATYASLVGAAGYSVSGLVTSIGGIAVTDAVTSVTQTIKSGAVVGSGSVVSGVAQNGSFNAIPSSAVGVGLSNYSITYVGIASTVNKATITVTAANDSKVYGNTTTAAGITYSTGVASASGGVGYSITSGSLLGSDTLTGVTLTSTGGNATTAVGTGISIVPSSASGSGISNYTITYANGTMAITQRPLTVTASNQSTDYGTSYSLGTSLFSTSGLVNTDAVSSATLKYSGSSTVAGTTNAGTYTGGIVASAATGTGLSNYSISYVAGNLTVATKALTITADTQNSTYGSAYGLGTSAFSTSGLVNSDAVTGVNLLYNNSATVAPTVHAATYSGGIVPSAAAGTGLSNYAISYVAGNLVVGKATITLTPNAAVTTYDGTTLSNNTYSQSVANYTISGYKNTDVAADIPMTLSGSMAFGGSTTTVVKNATSYSLAVGTLAGTTTNTNYQISFANSSGNTYLINPATVSVSATKDYDGSRTFTSNQITVTTGIGSETLALSGSATANSANVTGVSSLSTSGLTLGNGNHGGLAINYQLPASSSNVVINPLTLSASITGVPTKQYDATASATLTPSNYSLSGFIAGEGASVTQTVGSYNTANATSNTAYSPATIVTATLAPFDFTATVGTALSNYVLPTTATGNGVITTAPLTLSANSYAAFAGQSPASFTGSVTGAQGNDSITVSITQSASGTAGVYTLTPAAVMSTALVGNYSTPSVVTGTYTEAQQYQLVVSAANTSNSYGSLSLSSSANSAVNLLAQYCTVSSNCTSGSIVTLTLSVPSATVSQITTSSVTTPTWVATDSALNSYNIKVTADTSLGFSSGHFLNAGTYTLTPTGQSNATISGATNPVIYISGALTVSPVSVAVTNHSTPNKVYDATTTLTNGVSLATSNALTGDVVNVTGAGAYSSKNVGTTNYTITSVTLSGADAANYRYSAGNITGSNGVITPAPITISGLAASNKVYDAGLSASVSGIPVALGSLSSDTVTVSGTVTTGSFSTPDAASSITVTPVLTGLSLSNANYAITGVTSPLAANITTAPVTVTITKAYDGTASAANGDITITGVVGQTLVLASGTATLTSPNVGSAALATLNGASLANGTGLAANYTLSNPTGVVTITPAPISVSASNAVKVYDTATDILSATTLPSATLVSGALYTNSATSYTDQLFGGTFRYLTSAAGSGNKALSVSGVGILNGSTNAASNYAITYIENTTSTITPAPITISGLTAAIKQYDTGLTATVSGTPTAVGTIGGDAITVSGNVSSGTFASANVGTGIAVTPVLSGLSLSSANYQITGVSSALTASITPAPVTISGLSASNKVYDTGVSAIITGTATASGVLGADVVTVSGTATTGSFASANVGTGISVTPVISGLSLSNANYSINGITSALTANITAAPVTVTANAQSTTYGTPLALGTADFTTSGLLGSDAISAVTLTQLGNSTVPGTQNAGAYSGAVNGILPSAASGTNLSNYQITYAPGTLTIARKAINVIANNAAMTYADSSLPTLSYQSVSGLVNGDQISGTLATNATAYNGVAGSASNVGSYFITQGTVSAGANYDITFTRATLTVASAALSITAENQNSTYGSLLVLPQSGGSAYSVLGLKNGDSVSSATVLYSGNQTVPSTTNAGDYSGSVDVSAANGVRLANYNITYVPGNLSVAKAVLTVTAVDSGKFVGMNDPSGYGGVMFSGFKNADSDSSGALGSATVSVSRSNSSVNDAGIYTNVLLPNVSTSLQNYSVTYGSGKFVIVGANQLLVQVGANSTSYGTAPNYSASTMTVSYCTNCALGVSSPNIITVPRADIRVSGSSVTVVDGSTSGVFALSPANPTMNSSGTQLAVGSYSLGASGTSIFTSPTGGTPNFNEIQVIGGLTVTPLQLSYSDLGITGVSQVYNGSVNMTNLSLTASSGVLPGDVVTVAGTGTFASKNVGINIPYTVGIALTGADSANYQINSGSSYTGTNGAITQLHSVTYTGPNTGGSWSNPSYWTITGTTDTGAIPDLSNVANVILPTGKSVVYDDSVQGPVTSAVANSGNLSFNLATNTTIPMSISGVGSVTVSGAGAITLTGNSSYTGETILQAGTSLIAGSNHAIGAGNITSNGTSVNPASFSTSSAVVLPALNITGGSTKIRSDITTSGLQSYSGSVLIGASSSGTTTLASTNSNITFNGILDGVSNKSESLVINAGTGIVTIGDSVGSNYRLNNLTVTGSRIYILADILTAVVQTYNGSVYIGNASYLGRTPTVGFLFNSNYRGYFEYLAGGGVSASELSYLNSNSIYVRTMISEDPSITYNGSVNDTVANTHTLLAAAIASTSVPTSSGVNAINGAASINFNQSVGADAPLYSLNTQIRVNNTQSDSASSYIGTINLVDTVSTYSNQTYRANLMSARASTQPGSVTFSVWDPAANVSFNVPEQTVANSACSNNCGQINLQNPSSRDILTINGRTNFALDANLTGVNNWGNEYVQRNAIGYASPVTIPSIRPSNVSEINGGMLREVIDFHADQVQMAIATRISSRVLVGEPENIEITPLDSDKKSTLSNQLSAGTICTVDQFGDTQCEED